MSGHERAVECSSPFCLRCGMKRARRRRALLEARRRAKRHDVPTLTLCAWIVFSLALAVAVALVAASCCTPAACNDPRAVAFLCAYGHLPPAAELRDAGPAALLDVDRASATTAMCENFDGVLVLVEDGEARPTTPAECFALARALRDGGPQ